MQDVSYEDLLRRGDAGVIFLKMSYPVCRLRGVITKTDYTYVGFYTSSSEMGPPNILVDIIDVFSGALTPSWYRNSFTMEDLLNDKLVESIIVKPSKLNPATFRRAVIELTPFVPSYSWEQLLRSAVTKTDLVTDSDILLSFLEGLENEVPVASLETYPPISSLQEFICESRVLSSSMKVIFPIKNSNDIMAETESALFIEKVTFQKLSSTLLKLINEDADFRRDLAKQILMSDEESIFHRLQRYLQIELVEWDSLIHNLDKALLTGELCKKDLINSLEKISANRVFLREYLSLELPDPHLNNIDYASNITLDEISNSKELNLLYLHQLIFSLANDCSQGNRISIPINDLISATNRICEGVNLPVIPPVPAGSYSAILLSNSIGVKLETFTLTTGNVTLIPSNNADLDDFTLEQLQELNQILNKKKSGRVVNEHFHSLREKIAKTIAQRMQRQIVDNDPEL